MYVFHCWPRIAQKFLFATLSIQVYTAVPLPKTYMYPTIGLRKPNPSIYFCQINSRHMERRLVTAPDEIFGSRLSIHHILHASSYIRLERILVIRQNHVP